MALSSHEYFITSTDIASGFGIAKKVHVDTEPLAQAGSHSTEPTLPIVGEMSLIPQRGSVSPDKRIVTIEDYSSRIVGHLTTPDYGKSDVLIQAIEHPEPIPSDPPPTDNPFVNLWRFIRQNYAAVRSHGIGRK